jgi:putative chitinase
MEITAEHIKSLYPQYKHPADLAEVLTEQFEKYEINTVNRAAGFLAQCGHESNGFTVLKENLNYSADGLNKTFKKYFPIFYTRIWVVTDQVVIVRSDIDCLFPVNR